MNKLIIVILVFAVGYGSASLYRSYNKNINHLVPETEMVAGGSPMLDIKSSDGWEIDLSETEKATEIGFDPIKDARINSGLDSGWLVATKYVNEMYSSVTYELRYAEFKITAHNNLPIEYEQPDGWMFFCKTKSGQLLLIDTSTPWLRVSPATLDRIKQICLAIK